MTESRERAPAGSENRTFGREAELAAVADLLADPTVRLLTVTGPAGVGKSRLAREAALLAAPAFRGGVVCVELSESGTLHEAWQRIASALGVDGDAATSDVAAAIADQETLLLLDNCDLVVAQLSLRLAALITDCHGLHVLATSRTSMDVYAERLFLLRPLPVQMAEGSGRPLVPDVVRLFLDRVRGHYRDHIDHDADLSILTEICGLLDGLPLAVELAARSFGTLTLHDVLRGLRQGVPPGSSRLLDVSTRQRSMQAALAWSDCTLSDAERELIQRLCLCEGPFTLEAAQSVGGMSRARIMRHLEELIHKSLILIEQEGTEHTFRMLSATRAFHLRQLASDPERLAEARERHARYFLSLLAGDNAPGHEWEGLPATVRQHSRDLRDAVRTLRALGEPGQVVEAVLASEALWVVDHDPVEMSDHLEWAADCLQADGAAPAAGRRLLDRALETAGLWMVDSGRPDRARALWRKAMALRQEHDDRSSRARIVGHLGDLDRREGRSEEAKAKVTFAAQQCVALGDARGAALARKYLALVEHELGRPGASSTLRDAISALRSLGEQRQVGLALIASARFLSAAGKPDEARAEARSALEVLGAVGGPGDLAEALEVYGCALFASVHGARHHERIARMLLASRVLRERHGLLPCDTGATRDVERSLRATLGHEALEVLGRRLHSVSREAAVADAFLAVEEQPDEPVRQKAQAQGNATCLTPRQTEIALMVAEGMTNRQIARKLGLSEWTVVNHLRQVMQKLQAPSRVHVARVMQQREAS
jgi:predicted ATPase/DNA-binding CsgD family transcriptional regulator